MSGITERSFIASLTAAISDIDPRPTREEVVAKALWLAQGLGFTDPLDNAVEQAMISVSTRMGEGVSIVGNESHHDPAWVDKLSSAGNLSAEEFRARFQYLTGAARGEQ